MVKKSEIRNYDSSVETKNNINRCRAIKKSKTNEIKTARSTDIRENVNKIHNSEI